jgi:transcriptional regulator with XRE-family HTH domain
MVEGKIIDVGFGKRLLELREEKGLSREAAAKEIGIGLSSLQNYEKGSIPIPVKMEKILLYYKCNRTWLREGDPYPKAGGPETPPPASYIKEGQAAWTANGGEAQKINIDEAMGKAYEILHSGTPYSAALYLKIQQFSSALAQDATKELKVCQDKIADLQTQVGGLRRQMDGLTAPPVSSDQPADSTAKEVM